MSLVWAGSISLDSTFNNWLKVQAEEKETAKKRRWDLRCTAAFSFLRGLTKNLPIIQRHSEKTTTVNESTWLCMFVVWTCKVNIFLKMGSQLAYKESEPWRHRLNNEKDFKPEMSSLPEFNRVYRLVIQSVMLIFLTGFVKYCPYNLFFCLVLPTSPVWICIHVYSV